MKIKSKKEKRNEFYLLVLDYVTANRKMNLLDYRLLRMLINDIFKYIEIVHGHDSDALKYLANLNEFINENKEQFNLVLIIENELINKLDAMKILN